MSQHSKQWHLKQQRQSTQWVYNLGDRLVRRITAPQKDDKTPFVDGQTKAPAVSVEENMTIEQTYRQDYVRMVH